MRADWDTENKFRIQAEEKLMHMSMQFRCAIDRIGAQRREYVSLQTAVAEIRDLRVPIVDRILDKVWDRRLVENVINAWKTYVYIGSLLKKNEGMALLRLEEEGRLSSSK